jgi:hypothetical protein
VRKLFDDGISLPGLRPGLFGHCGVAIPAQAPVMLAARAFYYDIIAASLDRTFRHFPDVD